MVYGEVVSNGTTSYAAARCECWHHAVVTSSVFRGTVCTGSIETCGLRKWNLETYRVLDILCAIAPTPDYILEVTQVQNF